jgi:hypothetical protein
VLEPAVLVLWGAEVRRLRREQAGGGDKNQGSITMIYTSASKPKDDDRPIGYWSDLLRGYELVNGIETPPLNESQAEGREQELMDKWNSAPAEDRAFVQKSVRDQDKFIKEQTEAGNAEP